MKHANSPHAKVKSVHDQKRHSFGTKLPSVQSVPSKHAGSDPEAVWLRSVMAITASVQPESGRIVYARSDFPHPFQLRFSNEGVEHIVQNRPGSDLGGLVRVWPNASYLEASWCAGIMWTCFWQDATGLLAVSVFWTRFRSSANDPDNIVQNQPGSDLVLCQVLAKRIRSGSKPVCKNHPARFWPMLPT